MEAKQIAFLLVAVAVGSAIVFVVGFQAGIHIDAEQVFNEETVNSAAGVAAVGIPSGTDARGDYSFFDELRAPAALANPRKLHTPKGNANNSPELAKVAEKRRQREERRREWLAEKNARDNGERSPIAARAVPRKVDAAPTRPRRVQAAPEAVKAPVRTLEQASPQAPAAPEPPKEQVRQIPREPKGGYTLQLGAYGELDAARQMASRLGSGRVVQSSVPGRGTVYSVRIGRYTSLEDAHQAQQKVRSTQGMHAFVTPL